MGSPESSQDDLKLGPLFKIVWRRRLIVATTVLLVVFMTIIGIHFVKPKYAVFIKVAPVSEQASAALGQLGSLSQLAGINLTGDQNSNFKLYTEGLTSWSAAQSLALDQEFLRELYPLEWSEKSGKWVEPFSLTRPIANAVRALLGMKVKTWRPPNADRLYQLIQDNVAVVTSSTQPTVTVIYYDSNPARGKKFLLKLDNTVDTILRQRALTRATGYVEYIENQLNTVSQADIRSALITVLSEQEKNLMMAKASVPFSADIFSGPTIPETPASPQVLPILVIAALFGVVAGASIALLADWRNWPLSDSYKGALSRLKFTRSML